MLVERYMILRNAEGASGAAAGGGDGAANGAAAAAGAANGAANGAAAGAGGGNGSGTLASGGNGAAAAGNGAAASSPDWRAAMAGGNDGHLKDLAKYTDPSAVYNSLRSLQERVNSGQLRSALPEGANDKQIADWRKANGIPESPDKYEVKLPDGWVLGDADKPVVEGFTKAAHALNLPPKAVNDLLGWYYGELSSKGAREAEADATFRDQARDTLKDIWGAEFTGNMNAVKAFLSTVPKELDGLDADGSTIKGGLLLGGRLADGTKIGNSPVVLQWLAGRELERNPAARLVPAGTGDAGKSLNDEIANYKTMMAKTDSEWYVGPKVDQHRKRYMELIAARDRVPMTPMDGR